MILNIALLVTVTTVVLVLRALTRRGADAARSRDPGEVLLGMCNGDWRLVQRLISFELSRAPGISETEAARRAADRLRRDRR